MLVYEVHAVEVVGIIAPEVRGNGLPRQHPVLIVKEINEKVDLFPGQVYGLTMNAAFQRQKIHADLVERKHVVFFGTFPAHHGFDPGVQFGQGKGLDDKIISAFIQSRNFKVKRILR